MDPNDIVARWNNGEWPYRRLGDVMREQTGWSPEQYERWIASGAVPEIPVDPTQRVR